jgi:hypothetical protein
MDLHCFSKEEHKVTVGRGQRVMGAGGRHYGCFRVAPDRPAQLASAVSAT